MHLAESVCLYMYVNVCMIVCLKWIACMGMWVSVREGSGVNVEVKAEGGSGNEEKKSSMLRSQRSILNVLARMKCPKSSMSQSTQRTSHYT